MNVDEMLQAIGATPDANQYKFINYTGGTLEGIAGAGSGKSTSINHRALKMVYCDNIDPKSIVVIVYSHEGAIDLKKKYKDCASRLGTIKQVKISTFHSLFLNILQKFYGKLALVDKREQAGMIIAAISKNIKIQDENLYQTFTSLLTYNISNMLFTENEITRTEKFVTSNIPYEMYSNAVDDYKKRKERKKVIDFDDMMLLLHELLISDESVKAQVQKMFEWVIIDEYQDIAKLQIEILDMIIEDKNKITVVGDDDQCVYEWRGSCRDYLLDMPLRYKGTHRVTMDTNYRCPKNILTPIINSIARNEGRLVKNLNSHKDGGTLDIVPCKSNLECSKAVVKNILEKLNSEFTMNDLNDFAVLYRDSKQPMFVIDLLLREGIPIKLQRKDDIIYKSFIAKDISDAVALALSPFSAELFRRVSKKFIKGSRSYVDRVCKSMNGTIPWQKLIPASGYHEANAIKLFADLDKALESKALFADIIELVLPVYSTYLEMYSKFKNVPITQLYEIIRYIEKICRDQKLNYKRYNMYVEQTVNMLKSYDKETCCLNIITEHVAKGLEFKNVYILNDSDAHCPNNRRIGAMRELFSEEYVQKYISQERNLHYVAWTRASQYLNVTYDENEPSRFLIETGLLGDPVALLQALDDKAQMLQNARPVNRRSNVKDNTPFKPTMSMDDMCNRLIKGDKVDLGGKRMFKGSSSQKEYVTSKHDDPNNPYIPPNTDTSSVRGSGSFKDIENFLNTLDRDS